MQGGRSNEQRFVSSSRQQLIPVGPVGDLSASRQRSGGLRDRVRLSQQLLDKDRQRFLTELTQIDLEQGPGGARTGSQINQILGNIESELDLLEPRFEGLEATQKAATARRESPGIFLAQTRPDRSILTRRRTALGSR